jgi:hypothetical protein
MCVSGSGPETGQPIGKGCVCGTVGVAIPTAGAGAAKGFVGGRKETREGGGASGLVDEGLGGCGESTTGVGV